MLWTLPSPEELRILHRSLRTIEDRVHDRELIGECFGGIRARSTKSRIPHDQMINRIEALLRCSIYKLGYLHAANGSTFATGLRSCPPSICAEKLVCDGC